MGSSPALFLGRVDKQAGAVGVEGRGPAVSLQIRLQQTAVLCAGIVPHEARQQLAAGIVDHADQVQLLAASFQPVVLGGVPLHQLAAATPPRTPQVRSSRLAPAGFPQPGRGHPAPQRFAADVDAVALLQILRRQGRPKVGVERFGENRGGSLFHLGADLAVGGAAARRMDYGPVALAAELRQQPPHLPFAEADLLGGLLLGDQLLVGFVQRHQPVALSLCHQ